MSHSPFEAGFTLSAWKFCPIETSLQNTYNKITNITVGRSFCPPCLFLGLDHEMRIEIRGIFIADLL
jgi:hypothetical protein